MFCEQWVNDVHRALKELDVTMSQDLMMSANSALYTLTQSYIWRDEFKTFGFKVSEQSKNIGWITFDTVYDPLSDGTKELHAEGKIDIFENRYESYEDDINEAWECPYNQECSTLIVPPTDFLITNILEKLSSYSNHYAMLLETDPIKQKQHLESLNTIEYVVINSTQNIDQEMNEMMPTAYFDSSDIKSLFGHRYYAPSWSDNNDYLIAKNKIGVVGMSCLFNYEDESADFKKSLSFVSVSPSYRGQGIAKEMLNRILEACSKEGRFITRTKPSDIGVKVLYESFTRLALKHPLQVPFVESGLSSYAHVISSNENWQKLPKIQRFKSMNNILNKIRPFLRETNGIHTMRLSADDHAHSMGIVEKGLKVLDNKKICESENSNSL